MEQAQFIVLEGIDGAGTTTHTGRLVRALSAERPVQGTREPSDGPVGVMLRQILTGRLVVPLQGGARPPSWDTLALLFAADRMDHLDAEIEVALAQGRTVICDRYDYSSVAYQGVSASGASADAVRWLREINRHARRPDLTIVLDVPFEVTQERRLARGGSREIFDDDGLQRELAAFYRGIEQHFVGDAIVHVDADRDLDLVALDILAQARALWVE